MPGFEGIVHQAICAELTGSPRARFYNARVDCNVGTLSHSQAGGFEIHDVTSKEFFFQQYNSGGARIDSYTTPVTHIPPDGQKAIAHQEPVASFRANDLMFC